MKYDNIVIGSGSGGGVVATRLSEDPERSVLLLEAGPDYPDFERLPDEIKFGFASGVDIVTTHHNWEFTARGTDTSGPLQIPRGKVTGGTSAINGQVFLRGDPQDYDSWAALGNDRWGYQDLIQFFRRVETDTEFGGSDFHKLRWAHRLPAVPPGNVAPGPDRLLYCRPRRGVPGRPRHESP